jgi:eukaryotic-like serine/threonine-protein kinase
MGVAAMVVQGIPRLLGGRYELGEKVGSGAMAVVLDAVDRTLSRRVAVKVLFPHMVGDQALVERFQQEARSAARLSHPNVVAIFDVGTHHDADSGEIDFIVMEFVEGCTLRQELAAGPLPPARAATVAREMCAALQAAHAGALVHRDVKPANVMLARSGRVKVMDFGIARALDAARLTQTGLVVATAQYASPEQLQGQDVDARSDVYSLGCCLYEMLAGTPPFAGDDPVSVAFRQVHEAPMPVRQRNPLVPVGLAAVAARALEKEPVPR